jgi:hypothetical protein
MLAEKTYPQDYIDGCRARMDAQLAAYRALVTSSANAKAGRSALDAFEPLFFNHLVVALDAYFMHRTRAIEGKDGNPLNEVRMLTQSILNNDAVLSPDKTIKYSAATSVVGLSIGDEIRLDEAQFTRLSTAFFAEMETRFT